MCCVDECEIEMCERMICLIDNKKFDGKSIGQIVDIIADQNFAKGMDSYHAGKFALVEVLAILNQTEAAIVDFIDRIFPMAVAQYET